MSENEISKESKKPWRNGDCPIYKVPKNIQRYKRDSWSQSRPDPHIHFTISVHASDGFSMLCFLKTIPSTLLAAGKLCPHIGSAGCPGGPEPPEWPFTNNCRVQRNENPFSLLGQSSSKFVVESPLWDKAKPFSLPNHLARLLPCSPYLLFHFLINCLYTNLLLSVCFWKIWLKSD